MNGTHKQTQVPPGVQCFVGDEARRRRRIEEAVVSVFEGWDYEEIIPPIFDYADVFTGEALAPKTYSFIGRDGSVLALRPDFTSLIAKIAAGRLRDRPAPMRLYYSGEVVRFEPPKAGRQSELHQMGLEHLGGDSRTADAEVLAIAAECLERVRRHRLGARARPRRRLQRPRRGRGLRPGARRAAARARRGQGRRRACATCSRAPTCASRPPRRSSG